MKVRRVGVNDERGSGTVWILVVAMVVLAAGCGVGLVTQVVIARARAATAADAAALAGANHVLDGEEAACSAAADFARRNHGQLEGCTLDGADVEVRVEVTVTTSAVPPGRWVIPGSVRATARARLVHPA